MSLMGLDIGMTGCKAMAFNFQGQPLTSAYREYPLLHPHPGWSEQDTEHLWSCIMDVVQEVNAHVSHDPVEALAVSCQGEATTGIDRNGDVLFPMSNSLDRRTVAQAEWWADTWGAPRIFDTTGLPLHAMASLNKIMWYRENEPRQFEQAVKFLCIEDFVNYRLTGEFAIDWSLASRTMAFDVIKKQWSDEILRTAKIDRDLFARPLPSAAAVGTVSRRMRDALGFGPNVVVATGGHDQLCGALGAGIVKPGIATNATGTADVVCPVFAEPILTRAMLDNGYCCYPHTDPGKYASIAFNLTGGLLLRWYRDTLCGEERRRAARNNQDVYDVIIEEASSEPRTLFFLPHFVGSGTPHLDPASRGALVGLTIDVQKPHISKAVLDSICYEIKLNIQRMNALGMGIHELRAIGGGAKNSRLLQLKTDIYGLPLSSLEVSEAACLGAAILAGVGAGAFVGHEDAVNAMVRCKTTYEPDTSRTARYQEVFQLYERLYGDLKAFNHSLASDEAAKQ